MGGKGEHVPQAQHHGAWDRQPYGVRRGHSVANGKRWKRVGGRAWGPGWRSLASERIALHVYKQTRRVDTAAAAGHIGRVETVGGVSTE
jgi:hypothetical protein